MYLQHVYVIYLHFYVCRRIPISSGVSTVRPASNLFSCVCGSPRLLLWAGPARTRIPVGRWRYLLASASALIAGGSFQVQLRIRARTESPRSLPGSLSQQLGPPPHPHTPKQPRNWSIFLTHRQWSALPQNEWDTWREGGTSLLRFYGNQWRSPMAIPVEEERELKAPHRLQIVLVLGNIVWRCLSKAYKEYLYIYLLSDLRASSSSSPITNDSLPL